MKHCGRKIQRWIRQFFNCLIPQYNILKTIYYNFKWLPIKQAIKLPILLSNVRVHASDAEVIIASDKPIRHGMIRIGLDDDCMYWINKTTHLELREGGRIVFKGDNKIAIGSHIELEPNGYIEFGEHAKANCGFNLYSFYKVIIGANVKIGFEASIFDSTFHPMRDMVNGEISKTYSPVIIGEGCWIGAKVIIQNGTRLAKGSIVGMGAVVSGPFKEPNTIIRGNPAVVVDKGYCIEEDSFYDYSYIFAPRKCYK